MALVNCALELVQRGRRVLLLDFDLEAPGIPTFEGFSGATHVPGIVDYVTEYMVTGIAPKLDDFIYSNTEMESGKGNLWLIPAGKQGPGYSAKLQTIDWQRLYEQQAGFLVFEDMKEQWKKLLNPDYVLIDSRTGHTDVGGICTRQLPDAVCLMFFPNDQNLSGLTRIVEEIRSEAGPPRRREIVLHFAPSNVPDLDDEEGILEGHMKQSQSVLGYSVPTTIIHHYDSLALLDQIIFTRHRRSTKLAKEYQQLTTEIVAQNLQDRDAAIARLTNLQAMLGRPGYERQVSVADVEEKLHQIGTAHANDGEVLYRMAVVRMRMGNERDAALLLDAAIEADYDTPPVYMQRALCHRALRNDRAALADILTVISRNDVSERDFVFAARWLLENDVSFSSKIEGAPVLSSLSRSAKVELAKQMMIDRRSLHGAMRIFQDVIQQPEIGDEVTAAAKSRLVLCLIALRRYDEALEQIEQIEVENSSDSENKSVIAGAFNRAMADWGKHNIPSAPLFSKVAGLHTSDIPDPNFHECMALTYAVVGKHDLARTHLKKSRNYLSANPRSHFSCWRYLEVNPTDFRTDLKAIESLIEGERLVPEFIEGSAELPFDASRH